MSEITKAQEIERFHAFMDEVAAYPYLGPLMRDAAGPVVSAIRSDFLVAGLADLWRERAEMQAEAAAERAKAEGEVQKLKAEARQLERTIRRAREELADIRRVAVRICEIN